MRRKYDDPEERRKRQESRYIGMVRGRSGSSSSGPARSAARRLRCMKLLRVEVIPTIRN